ncbi:MAG: tRNA 2-thiouridine(34) synthase MnmA, partial [Vicinamibacteria bacterium]|nr:tRNA 2-thiouridine(34) synthase MnmA [Vicinamibacteria bacterium]
LFALTQDQLAHAAFPIGDMDKASVRAYAHTRGLLVADKPDSQEICFIADGDYARFVEQRLPDQDRGGVITNSAGQVLGRHDGVHRYTVGQRKGLRLSSTTPLYVLELKAESRTVVVGDRASLGQQRCEVTDVNWTGGAPPVGPINVGVQIRHRHEPAAAAVTPGEAGRATVAFEVPQGAVTPGQAAVFYDGDEVVGGGWISNP